MSKAQLVKAVIAKLELEQSVTAEHKASLNTIPARILKVYLAG